jgi:hypothetical protein
MKGYNHAIERKLSSHQSGETVINIRKKIIKIFFSLKHRCANGIRAVRDNGRNNPISEHVALRQRVIVITLKYKNESNRWDCFPG